MSRKQLGPHQRKILEILVAYPELTTKEIAEILYGKKVDSKSSEVNAAYKSLRSLEDRGLVERVGGKVKWRKTK